MNETFAVCRVTDLKPGEARRFDVAGHRVAVVRIGDDWYAIGDRCSHAEASLAEGTVWEDEQTIECPRHGSSFSLVDGQPDSLPATMPVAVYRVWVDGDDVKLGVGE